jgi:hypothetical protein
MQYRSESAGGSASRAKDTQVLVDWTLWVKRNSLGRPDDESGTHDHRCGEERVCKIPSPTQGNAEPFIGCRAAH